jgi:hypothetical protein
MPIEELTSEEVLQRCSMCQTATRSKLAVLSLGVGSAVADDLDGDHDLDLTAAKLAAHLLDRPGKPVAGLLAEYGRGARERHQDADLELLLGRGRSCKKRGRGGEAERKHEMLHGVSPVGRCASPSPDSR